MTNDGWVILRDEKTNRFLGRFDPKTGKLVIPHRGHDNEYDLRNIVPLFKKET